jgi:hypothetical protein
LNTTPGGSPEMLTELGLESCSAYGNRDPDLQIAEAGYKNKQVYLFVANGEAMKY